MRQHVERIEQAGDRVIVTAGGVVHDMVVDGTLENGVNDVMAVDFTTVISVAARYEDGVLVLRPQGLPGIEVRRWHEGDELSVAVQHRVHGAYEAGLASPSRDGHGRSHARGTQVVGARICTGARRLVVEPSPNCPSMLRPHDQGCRPCEPRRCGCRQH